MINIPIISHFFGIKIYMYFSDIKQHKKPHIHVFYGEYEAIIALDGEMLAGALPKKQYRMVEAWIIIHEDELYQGWIHAVRNEEPNKIEPLK